MRIVVIGVGNAYRGDDGAGLEVAKRLRSSAPDWVSVLERDGEASGLVDAWEDADVAVVVDAVVSDQGRPGQLYRVEVDATGAMSPARAVSSHAASPGEAVELARALGRLPGRLVLYGIEGRNFALGLGLSPEVEASIPAAADLILEDVRAGS